VDICIVDDCLLEQGGEFEDEIIDLH